jgi:hypothetical protein
MRPLDGTELRDQLATDYRQAAQRAGKDVSHEDAGRVASADLEMVDIANRVAKPVVAKPAPEPKKTRKAVLLEQEMAARGDRLVRREIAEETPFRSQLKGVARERYHARMRRLGQILECDRVPGARFLSLADRPYKHRALALDYLQEHADWTWSRRQYAGLSEADRDRKFARAIDDICDRSTGVLGAWWVK